MDLEEKIRKESDNSKLRPNKKSTKKTWIGWLKEEQDEIAR